MTHTRPPLLFVPRGCLPALHRYCHPARPYQADRHKKVGDEAFHVGDHERAIEHYSAAIELAPSNHKLFSNRSVCRVKLKQYKEALRDADECVRLAPQWFKAHYRSGMACFHLGRYRRAARSHARAVALDPANVELRRCLAQTQMMRERQLTLVWNQPKTSGRAHSGFFHTSTCVVRGLIYFFGGIGESQTVGALSSFEPKRGVWEQLREKHKPEWKPFFFHTASRVEDKIVVCRTIVGDETSCALVYNVDTNEWQEPPDQSFPKRQRISHSTSVVGDRRLYLFGGMSQDCESYNDFDILDTRRMVWLQEGACSTNGSIPQPRHSHTMTTVQSHFLFLIGGTQDPDSYVEPRSIPGVQCFDTRSHTWFDVECAGEAPAELVHHTATPVLESKILVMGGRTPKRSLRMHVLDTELHQWYSLKLEGVPPLRRIGAAASVVDDKL